eukprot:137064_1
MSIQTSNLKKRRFQGTGFGLDRDVSAGDSLPIWKKKMFDRIRNRSKQHRQSLLQRLEQQKHGNKTLSPNSQKQNAHNTIDSFKNALIEHEMKHQFTNNNHTSHSHHHTNTFHEEEEDPSAHLTPEQYKVIFAELASYLEETELSDLRQSYVASLEEKEKDQEMALFEEVMANDAMHNPHVVYCPICCKDSMEIEYMASKQPIYSCLCGIKFQTRDKSLCTPHHMDGGNCDEDDDMDVQEQMESDVDVAHRMLKSLKDNLQSIMRYHCGDLKCDGTLNFAVIEESGYLQCWCCQCQCNEIVI